MTALRRRGSALALAVLVVNLDQVSKQWLLDQPLGLSRPLLPGFINLRLVWNDGAAFSLFSNGALWLGLISLLVSIGLIGWIWHCLLYTSPSPRDISGSRMPSSA